MREERRVGKCETESRKGSAGGRRQDMTSKSRVTKAGVLEEGNIGNRRQATG